MGKTLSEKFHVPILLYYICYETMLPKQKHSEAVVRSCSIKKVILKIQQNSQENTCARISESQAEACNFIKRATLTKVFFSELCKIFKNTIFIEHLRWLLLNTSCGCLKKITTTLQCNQAESVNNLIFIILGAVYTR